MTEALEFLKKFANGYRIVSTGDLTELQILNAKSENRFYVEPNGGLGWVALPWDLTTTKDKDREHNIAQKNKPIAQDPFKQSPIMQYFAYTHLPDKLQVVSKPIFDLARQLDNSLSDGPEKSTGLRKLLEAKDCFVRQALN